MSNPLDERKRKLSEQIAICEEVGITLDTKGWSEIISPILESMIREVDGGIGKDGRWCKGLLLRKDVSPEILMGRKDGLIDFYNKVYDHLLQKDLKKKEYENVGKVLETETYPMEDTRYA